MALLPRDGTRLRSSTRTRRLSGVGLAVFLVGTASSAFAVCPLPANIATICPTTSCPSGTNPGTTCCTISTIQTIDDGCLLDFGNRKVIVGIGGTLKTAAHGHSYTMKGGEFIVNGVLEALGGTLKVEAIKALPLATGNFKSEVAGGTSPAKIDVHNGGVFQLNAQGTGTIGGQGVNATGGTVQRGGTILLASGGVLSVNGNLDASGSSPGANPGHGGYIELISFSTIFISQPVTANASGNLTTGGGIFVLAAGDMWILHDLNVRGAGDGDGGFIEIKAFGPGGAALLGNYNANGTGNGTDANGGLIMASATAISIGGQWRALGNNAGTGGYVEAVATSGLLHLLNTGLIDVSGGSLGGGQGGSALLAGLGNVTLEGDITANGGGLDSHGGEITVSGGSASTHTLTVATSSLLQATSNSQTGGIRDGSIHLGPVCKVVLDGVLDTRHVVDAVAGGNNVIEYHGSFDGIGGTMEADNVGDNTFICRCKDNTPANGVCDTPVTCADSLSFNGLTHNPSTTPTVTPQLHAPCN